MEEVKAILCFGDSITFGRIGPSNKGWCERLKNGFESKEIYNYVYNLGIPGDTTHELLKRFDSECSARATKNRKGDKSLIIFSIGINDSKWRGKISDESKQMTIKIYKKNILKLIKKSKNYTRNIMFIGLTPVDEKRTLPFEDTNFTNERVKKFNDTLKQLCTDNDVLFLDMYDLMKNYNISEIMSDGLHPNSKGYNIMFRYINNFIQDNKLI